LLEYQSWDGNLSSDFKQYVYRAAIGDHNAYNKLMNNCSIHIEEYENNIRDPSPHWINAMESALVKMQMRPPWTYST
jgi:hypothetical protein